jgi:uncharacterized protein YndB with AHSA1/START domain
VSLLEDPAPAVAERAALVPLSTRVVRHQVRVEAPPETVFAFVTDQTKMTHWIGCEATLDPRPGGICRINMSRAREAVAVSGEFVDVVPFERIVIAWGWEDDLFGMPPGSTRVEVTLLADGDATLVELVHRRVPYVAAELHLQGWAHYCARLAAVAAGCDPGGDGWELPATVGAALRDGVMSAYVAHMHSCSTG